MPAKWYGKWVQKREFWRYTVEQKEAKELIGMLWIWSDKNNPVKYASSVTRE